MSSKGWWKKVLSAALIGGAGWCVAWGVPPPDQAGWPVTVSAGGNGVTSDMLVGDVDGNGDLEVVFTTYTNSMKLYVYNHDGTVLAGWPQDGVALTTVRYITTPSMADLTGDGKLEILTVIDAAGAGDFLRCYKYDGTILWTVAPACCGLSFRTPSIADVDGDGLLNVFSIAAGAADQMWLLDNDGKAMSGFPQFFLSGSGRSQFGLADVDTDGDLEILVSAWEAFQHDGTVVSGYPKADGLAPFTVIDWDGDGVKDLAGAGLTGEQMTDLDINPYPAWPQVACGGVNAKRSICDVGNDGLLEMGFATVTGCADSLLRNYDGTLVTGWPADRGNFSGSDEMLIGDTDGDGQLNFINGAGEGDFSPDGRIDNFKEDGTSATGFPWLFPNPSDAFGWPTGVLVDLDLDGDVELGMATDNSMVGTLDRVFFWDLPVFYNPLNMHWRMAGGNMQHTGEWHPPSYYVPQVSSLSPALTWVTSCPVGTLQCSGASFESKPFVWFVPSADAPLFYGGDLSKGIPAVAVAQPQIHPVSGTPQNPLNATYLEITPPALGIGSYELVIQNPTGIRNMVKPVITVTDDVGASAAPVGDTLMVNFGPTESELAFDWGDVGNTEYVVIYDTAPDGLFDNETGRATTNALTVESPAGTDLFFQVVGVNSCGLGT